MYAGPVATSVGPQRFGSTPPIANRILKALQQESDALQYIGGGRRAGVHVALQFYGPCINRLFGWGVCGVGLGGGHSMAAPTILWWRMKVIMGPRNAH